MHKGIRFILPLSLIFFSLNLANLNAQSLTYQLTGDSLSPDTLTFSPHLPDGFDLCRIEFDVASETILTN
jgi:hypothetical protein